MSDERVSDERLRKLAAHYAIAYKPWTIDVGKCLKELEERRAAKVPDPQLIRQGFRVSVLTLHAHFMESSTTSWLPVGPTFDTRDAALIAGAASYGLSKYGETWNVVPTIQAFTVS